MSFKLPVNWIRVKIISKSYIEIQSDDNKNSNKLDYKCNRIGKKIHFELL